MSRHVCRLVSGMTWLDLLFYRGLQLGYRIFLLPWRFRRRGMSHVPKTGAVILASNHISLLDPPIVGSSLWRPIHFMAKEELFQIPVMGRVIRRVNAFPVRRAEHDLSAFKNAQRVLEGGDALIVFPEGHRSKTGVPGSAKAGVGMLACLTQSPVIPVLIENANRLRSLKQVRITFGAPIPPPPPDQVARETYQAFSDQVMNAINALREDAHG